MEISITDPIFQTNIFITIFLAIVLFTTKKDESRHEMLLSHTSEMKGLAMLMVLFCHIGYFLFKDPRFLFPLSVDGGVGVNIFLFLSGFGITISMLKKPLTPGDFYLKKLPGLYVPMWVILVVFLTIDALILHIYYPSTLVLKNFLGFFPQADIFGDLNSPLWYFSWMVFYYFVFPLVFYKKKPYFSALIIFLASLFLVHFRLPINEDVQKLYELHTLAFPLGMVFAYFISKKPLSDLKQDLYALRESHKKALKIFRYFAVFILVAVFAYTSIHSGVGKSVLREQALSIITTLSIILLFLLKRYKSDFLVLLGIYSYEIYLLQWPILYRYDFIYKYFPAGDGTMMYLLILAILGMGLNKFTKIITSEKQRT